MRTYITLAAKILALSLLYLVLLVTGNTLFVASHLSASTMAATDGVRSLLAMLVVALVDTLVVALIVLRSRWGGWRLMLALAFALYGVMTFLAQIEVAWFAPVMTTMAITPALIRGLLLQTVPIALIFVPVAVLALGRGRQRGPLEPGLPLAHTPAGWAVRLALIAAAYLVLYFGFGALVAWQNPAVRALYDQGRDPLVFAPWRLIPFQLLRSQLWVLFALPVVAMLRGSRWQVAVVVGLLFALPMNIVHVIPNPIMEPSVRLSHFVETASSNFLFGLLVAGLLLYRPRPASRPLTAQSA
jgi:hypothetical protein